MTLISLLEKQFKPVFYSLAIVIGIYLSVQEFSASTDLKNFNIFFVATFLIYITQITVLSYESKTTNSFVMELADEQRKVIKVLNIFVLPIAGIINTIILGLLNEGKFSFILILITFALNLIVIFNNVENSLKSNKHKSLEIDISFDILKLYLVFIITGVIIMLKEQEIITLFSAVFLFFLSIYLLSLMIIGKFKPTRFNSWLISLLPAAILSLVFLLMAASGHLFININLPTGYFTFLFFSAVSVLQLAVTNDLNRSILFKYALVAGLSTLVILLVGA